MHPDYSPPRYTTVPVCLECSVITGKRKGVTKSAFRRPLVFRAFIHCLLLLFAAGGIPAGASVKKDATAAHSRPEAVSQRAVSKKIVVLGDSLSAAYGLSKEEGWVHMLQQGLDEAGHAIELVNASISGATTAAGLQRLPSLLEAHMPDALVLQLGANDGLQGKPVPYIKNNLERMLAMLQSKKIKVLILGVHLPPNFGTRYTKPFYSQYRELSEKFGAAYLPFLLEGVATDDKLMQRDGLHPNAAGQKKVLQNVKEVFFPFCCGKADVR